MSIISNVTPFSKSHSFILQSFTNQKMEGQVLKLKYFENI